MTSAGHVVEQEIRKLLLARIFIERTANNYERRIAITGSNRLYRIVFLPGGDLEPAALRIYDGKNTATVPIAAAGGPRAAVSQAVDLITNSSRLDPPWSYAFGGN